MLPAAVRPRRARDTNSSAGEGQDEADPREVHHPEDWVVREHGVGDGLARHGA